MERSRQQITDNAQPIIPLVTIEAGVDEDQVVRVSHYRDAKLRFAHSTISPGVSADDVILVVISEDASMRIIEYSVARSVGTVVYLEQVGEKDNVHVAWGADALDESFVRFLDTKYSSLGILNKEAIELALVHFKSKIKYDFDNRLDDPEVATYLPIKTQSRQGVEIIWDALTAREVRIILDPVVEETICFLKGSVCNRERSVWAVIPIGPFFRCTYLTTCLQAALRPAAYMPVRIMPMASPLESASVAAKSPRFETSYGICICEKYIEALHGHLSRSKCRSTVSGDIGIELMSWFVKKGDTVAENETRSIEFWQRHLGQSGRPKALEYAILYDNAGRELASRSLEIDDHMAALGTVSADLSAVPESELPRVHGADRQWYYEFDVKIEVTFQREGVSCSIRCNDTRYGPTFLGYERGIKSRVI
ncbi:uncharacterized protein F5Z01DRAFT_732675 [Emericellopsis atlantica]|uniref:Uncharacterized protein n=1 Tax=Emericellopsis atlantica TaxID=2614577 RepID=A0A9P7ZVV3_9HYPO|nr:uncharacterized protein F5Z01DRAFT_732675 [Emericellopsis atlantica]KAG9259001.1 hypothetical protein F5Z01DRAFT_732675 [Emericellopsis atlantica]